LLVDFYNPNNHGSAIKAILESGELKTKLIEYGKSCIELNGKIWQ